LLLNANIPRCNLHHRLPAEIDADFCRSCSPCCQFKFFVSHVSEHFIEERRCLLDSYLNKMLKVPDVVKSDVWLEFFSSDALDDYVEPPQETAIPDDCEITSVSIPQTRLMSDHVLFQVDVMNAKKRRTFQKWTVLKRYARFQNRLRATTMPC
jgi:hypothetical protein